MADDHITGVISEHQAGKVLAALTDDQIRSMVRKAQQALEPPTGIKKQLDINDPTAN